MLCKREMNRDEVTQLVQAGETEFLTQFISKKGRPFSAKLRLEATGRFTFEFPERVKKAPKSANDSESSDGSDQEAPIKKAKAKKTVSKKTSSTKKASSKKTGKKASKKKVSSRQPAST